MGIAMGIYAGPAPSDDDPLRFATFGQVDRRIITAIAAEEIRDWDERFHAVHGEWPNGLPYPASVASEIARIGSAGMISVEELQDRLAQMF